MPDRSATATRSAAVALAAAAIALVLGALVFLIGETVAAAAWTTPGYSYGANFVSDLGNPHCGPYGDRVVCSPSHTLMNTAFVVQGLLVGAASWLLGRVLPHRSRVLVRGLGVAIAAGFALVGIVHSSPATSADGTLWLHYLGATVAILGTNTSAVLLGRQWPRLGIPAAVGRAGVVLGGVGLVAAVIWLATFTLLPPGIFERTAIYPFVLWQLLLGGFLLHVTQPVRLLLDRSSGAPRR
ncbi:DUF998 domain-containing protein [Amycolatopsis sp. NPDC026612]|uniref:DUF998 domain-containing protein n=1 Tax=Amycolatopsis sp. NPDC026612 TaxID=3155466 RepID=UPI0033D4C939